MVRIVRALAVALCAAALQGCASAPATPGPHGDRNVLAIAEIDRTEFPTIYDVIYARRRSWLIERPVERADVAAESGGATGVVVYLDDMRLGGTAVLKEIVPSRVFEVRYYNGIAAYGRWGLGHDRGVIQVITTPARPAPGERQTPP